MFGYKSICVLKIDSLSASMGEELDCNGMRDLNSGGVHGKWGQISTLGKLNLGHGGQSSSIASCPWRRRA
jgi:hypothetical protein